MGFSLFSVMVRLNCAITTSASLPRIPSIERTNGENFPLVVTVLTMLISIDIFSPIQEHCHWFILVGIRISVAKFYINDGFDLSIP